MLGRHVAEHALRVCTPVREYYLVGLEHTDNAQQWQTEIAWPIQRTPSEHSEQAERSHRD